MKTRTNIHCACCSLGINAINGRYCSSVKRYVEYAVIPPCREVKEKTITTKNDKT